MSAPRSLHSILLFCFSLLKSRALVSFPLSLCSFLFIHFPPREDRSSLRDTDARRKAREAREAALRAATEIVEEEQPRHPSQWPFNDCVKWLRHHGFKDFVDTFYNNGFEGRHLVALQVRRERGTERHTKMRVLTCSCLVRV